MSWIDRVKLPWDAGYRLVMEDEGLELSGYIAFTAFVALFPFLIFLAALAGFLGDDDTASDFVAAMFEFMPDDVAETLAPAIYEVIESRRGGLLTFGIASTLWVSSSGIEALRAGLNRAYGVREERPMWWLRLQSFAFVIVGALVIFFLSLAVILGPIVWRVLGPGAADLLEVQLIWITVRYVVAAVLLWGALMMLHHWLPNTKQAFREVLPGVCATVVIWLAGASLFSWYLGNLADYSVVYGGLGGVTITLVFFYITAAIFIYGAELNAAWRRRAGMPKAEQDVKEEEEQEERRRWWRRQLG
jgi:membrane protein